MKKFVGLFVFLPMLALAQVEGEFETFGRRDGHEKRRLICNQLSDSACFSRRVNSLCIKDLATGLPGVCRIKLEPQDYDWDISRELVLCKCY